MTDDPPLDSPLEVDAEHIPLDASVLCADCSNIYRLTRDTCPACGSHTSLALSLVLSSDRNKELIDGLRALAKLFALAKRRPPRAKKETNSRPPTKPRPNATRALDSTPRKEEDNP